mgnify:CR=1 FL=1
MEKNKQAGNDQAQETPARDRVYDIPNGYRDSAETMFRRLQHQGFTPEWDMGQREGQFMLGITIPQNETSQLRLLQKSNPATWGNHPDVEAMLDKNKQDEMKNTPLPSSPEKDNLPEAPASSTSQPQPTGKDGKPVPVAAQKESKEAKERREARAILMERRDIEPGCPVPQRSPEIPPDKDY